MAGSITFEKRSLQYLIMLGGGKYVVSRKTRT